MRIESRWILGSAAVAALALVLSPALGGEGGSRTLSLLDAEGEAGGDAGVTIQLDNDDDSAVSAGLDITFNPDDLTFTEPVSSSCTLDARIASTHEIAGRILSPGVVNVEILVSGTPDPLPALGNGPLAVCNFTIRGDAMVDDMFPVGATNVFIGDDLGGELPSGSDDGVITVVAGGPTPTATATASEAPTETPTEAAPTATATATATEPTPIVCGDDSDCPTGLGCTDGTCQPIPCDTDEDCPPGSQCPQDPDAATSGNGAEKVCVPLPCDTDDDCPDRSVCDEGGMCRPEFCDDNEDCEGDDVCASDGICSSICDDDSQCAPGVCVDGTCVECRDDEDCDANEECVSNMCLPIVEGFALAVSPSTQMGVAGGSAAIEVVLSGDSSSTAADTVSNSLAADQGLGIEACSVAGEIPGGIEGTPGTTVSATLGDGDGSVPTGTIYSCAISIAEDAEGTLAITCGDATVNGQSVTCSSAVIEVEAAPTPTPTMMPTATFTMTQIPTDTPTNTPRFDFEDDGCAVGPAPAGVDAGSLLFLLAPALLLWRRRR